MEIIKTPQADLENKRFIFGEIGLITALILVFFAFGLKTQKRSNQISDNIKLSNIAEEMIPITVQETKPPMPPPTKTLTVINIVNNEIEVESDVIINAEANQETVIEEFIPFVPPEEEEESIDEERCICHC